MGKTIMILGAGASWDYGFPTGEQLLQEIREVFDKASANQTPSNGELGDFANLLLAYTKNICQNYCDIHNSTIFAKNALGTFRDLLDGQLPVSIDWFLQQSFGSDFQVEKYKELGKFAISLCIGKYESKALDNKMQPWRPKQTADTTVTRSPPGWYRQFWQSLRIRQISDFEELVDSQRLRVITFNYDRSFEKFILDRLTSLYAARNIYTAGSAAEDAKKLLTKWNIQHVYGSLGGVDSFGKITLQTSNALEAIAAAANTIEIIRENSSDRPKNEGEIQKLVTEAQNIIFLGFGFDETNCKLLAPKPLEKGHDQMFATTFGLGSGDRTRVIRQLIRSSDFTHEHRQSLINIKDEHSLWDIDQYLRHYSPFASVACPG